MHQIYTREPADGTGILRELKEAEDNLAEYKSTQVVGNDNLMIRFDVVTLAEQAVTANVTALFQATYTFDDPNAEAFVHMTLEQFSITGSGFFIFNEQRYDDPATIDDSSMARFMYSFTANSNVSIGLNAFAKSTQPGSLSFVRLV